MLPFGTYQSLRQIMGRVVRKDKLVPNKIGYVIAFQDVARKMPEIVGEQKVESLGEKYLEQNASDILSCHILQAGKLYLVSQSLLLKNSKRETIQRITQMPNSRQMNNNNNHNFYSRRSDDEDLGWVLKQ